VSEEKGANGAVSFDETPMDLSNVCFNVDRVGDVEVPFRGGTVTVEKSYGAVDVMTTLLLALLALDDPRVDAVLRACDVSLNCNGEVYPKDGGDDEVR